MNLADFKSRPGMLKQVAVILAIIGLFGACIRAWDLNFWPPISMSQLEKIPPNATRADIENMFGKPTCEFPRERLLQYHNPGRWHWVTFYLNEDDTLKKWAVED